MALKGDTSDLDTLTFGGKPMVPLVQGFSKYTRSGVVNAQFQGGSTRQRKKYFNNPHVAEASFFLESGVQHDYIQMFFNRNEGKSFICYLSADYVNVEPYVVKVISDWNFPYNSLFDSMLTVTIEITPSRSYCYDNYIFDMTQCLGSELGCMLDELQYLVKVF